MTYREWATHREEGDLCPTCGVGRLLRAGQVAVCSECGEVWPYGWARGYFSDIRPGSIHGLAVGQGPLYASLQRYAGPEAKGEHLMDFALDLDYKTFDQAVKAAQAYAELLKGEPFHLYFSGSKGFHFVFRAESFGQEPSLEPHRVLRRIAQRLELKDFPIDYAAYTRSRLFRAPNSRHPKTGLYKVQILPEEIPYARELAKSPRPLHPIQGPSALLSDLYRQVVTEPPPAPTSVPVSSFNFVPPCFARLMEEGPPDYGTRHALTLQLAVFFVRSGRSKDELLEWAASMPGVYRAKLDERVADAARAYDWALNKNARFRCSVMQRHGLCSEDCPLYGKT